MMTSQDDFLADAYAQLPVSRKPWECMVCADRFATLKEIDAHIEAMHPDSDEDN